MFRPVPRPSSGAQNSKLNFELLMMGGETARNMQRIDSNNEYCIALHLVDILGRIL
jgi:hypothetical protein